MAKARKRVSRRSKAAKTKSPRRTKAKTKGKTRAKGRVKFSSIWQNLGNAILHAVEKDRGWDRQAFIAKLANDPEFQRLVLEKTIRLLPPNVPTAPATEVAATSACPTAAAAPSCREGVLADEYLIATREAARDLETPEDESTPAATMADWRIF